MIYFRLLPFKYNDPSSNMAIDESILADYKQGGILPTFRLYGWRPKGISLGLFQDPDKVLNLNYCLEKNVPFVKRMTGGEAIFHAEDISYSITCSREDLGLPKSIKESFKKLCKFIINAYKNLGLDASFFGTSAAESERSHSSFCFAGAREFDIAINGKKIGGNAQKRLKNIIFQHGSIPLKFNMEKIRPFFKENLHKKGERIVSLEEALGRKVDPHELSRILVSSFKDTFKIDFIEEKYPYAEYDSPLTKTVMA